MTLTSDPLTSTYQVLGLQVCTTTRGSLPIFESDCFVVESRELFIYAGCSSSFALSCQNFLVPHGLSFPLSTRLVLWLLMRSGDDTAPGHLGFLQHCLSHGAEQMCL